MENLTEEVEIPELGEEITLPEITEEEVCDTPRDTDGEKSPFDSEAEALLEIGILPSKERYLALRALGLSAKEAYLATSHHDPEAAKAHLRSAVPGHAKAPKGGMSTAEMEMARGLFSGLSDAEIHKLYKKVTR